MSSGMQPHPPRSGQPRYPSGGDEDRPISRYEQFKQKFEQSPVRESRVQDPPDLVFANIRQLSSQAADAEAVPFDEFEAGLSSLYMSGREIGDHNATMCLMQHLDPRGGGVTFAAWQAFHQGWASSHAPSLGAHVKTLSQNFAEQERRQQKRRQKQLPKRSAVDVKNADSRFNKYMVNKAQDAKKDLKEATKTALVCDVAGAAGPHADTINGSYDVKEKPLDKPPAWRKRRDPLEPKRGHYKDIWLYMAKGGVWNIGSQADKTARRRVGCCYATDCVVEKHHMPYSHDGGWTVLAGPSEDGWEQQGTVSFDAVTKADDEQRITASRNAIEAERQRKAAERRAEAARQAAAERKRQIAQAENRRVTLDKDADGRTSEEEALFIFKQIRKVLQGKLKRVIDLFRDMDKNHDGLMSKRELATGMAKLGYVFGSKQEIADVFHFLNKDGGDTIEYEELFAYLNPALDNAEKDAAKQAILDEEQRLVDEAEAARAAQSHDKDGDGRIDLEEAMAIFKRIRGVLQDKLSRVNDLFRDMDTSNDGKINKFELEDGLAELGFHFESAQELGDVFGFLDRDGSGECDFREIQKYLNPALDNADKDAARQLRAEEAEKRKDRSRISEDEAETIFKEIRDHLQGKLKRVIDLFRDIDKDNSGCVNKKELGQGLAKLGYKLSKKKLTGIFNFLDIDGQGTVEYRELHAYLNPTLDLAEKKAKSEAKAAAAEAKREERRQYAVDHALSDEAAEDVLKQIRQVLQDKLARVIDIFRDMDASGDGIVDMEEMRGGFKQLGYEFESEAQFEGLFFYFDHDGGDSIDYRELQDLLNPAKDLAEKEERSVERAEAAKAAAEKHLAEREEKRAKARANLKEVAITQEEAMAVFKRIRVKMQSKLKRVMDLFHDMDENKDGKINEEEMIAGLTKLGFRIGDHLGYTHEKTGEHKGDEGENPMRAGEGESNWIPTKDIQSVFYYLDDDDGNGTIDYKELRDYLNPALDGRKKVCDHYEGERGGGEATAVIPDSTA